MYHLGSVQSKRISTDIQLDILFVQRNHFPENYEHAFRRILENYSRKFFLSPSFNPLVTTHICASAFAFFIPLHYWYLILQNIRPTSKNPRDI